MSDAFVSAMLNKLAAVSQDQFLQRVKLVVGVEDVVQKLTTTFKLIQAYLNHAEQRQMNDEDVKLWLADFNEIAYDMDDVLDEWSFQMHRSQSDTYAPFALTMVSSYLCSVCSCFGEIYFRYQIGSKIKDIRERLDQAEREKNRFSFIEIKSNENPIERLQSSSLIDVSGVFGRVADKETIMNKLMFLGEGSTSTSTHQPESSTSIQALHAPKIIAIVGLGGLGKTTLAQLVFNDDKVKTHFEKTMWVCVSNPFDRVIVTKAIIEEAKCKVPKSSEWNTLQRSLCESIKGKRFLLVLDDVWTENRSLWESLEVSLRFGAEGSRILVTTRNKKVALMMNPTYIHTLGELSDNDCSLLLSSIALAGRTEENLDELKEIGEEISKKCKGSPLVAKTLGGLLHFKKIKQEWSSILKSEIWKLEEVQNDFLKPALWLSYYDLPLPIKGCFVYSCTIFLKNYTIEKDILVKLWMAQGFLNSTSGNEELEMIGDDYFNNLVMRSFFQDLSKDSNGNIISVKIHDLVHDFAEFLKAPNSSNSRVERHLSLIWTREVEHSSLNLNSLSLNVNKLRTLRICNPNEFTVKEVSNFHPMRCLKVLCLIDTDLESLSSEVKNLIHLRYLDLSNNKKLNKLPETISNLYNLQTLKLKGCECLCKLPREMRRMINLRHLDIRGTDQLSHLPQGIRVLTSLRTLTDFIVGGASEGCRIGELKDLNLLQGDLSIRGLGRVETVDEAIEMEMKQKHLSSLMLGFEPNEETDGLDDNLENSLSKRMEDVLEALEPHPDVVELGVIDYVGFKLSSWIGRTSVLPHMKTLKLHDCINLTKFPAFGQLPSLEVLDIERAINVKHIGFEFYTNSLEHVNRVAFPKLKELSMGEMNNLEVWELQHGVVMPYLDSIMLYCPKLKALPALGKLPSLKELFIFGANELRHVGCELLYEVDETVGERFNNIAFPMLLTLGIASEVLEWELGVIASTGKEIIMPCLRELIFSMGFKILKPFLEDLSKMSSLEILSFSVKATEFIEYIRNDDQIAKEIMFPNLKVLRLHYIWDMEELKIGFQVMPLLQLIEIEGCNNLKAIQSLSKLDSLVLHECASLCELQIPNLKYLLYNGGRIHPSLFEALPTTLQALKGLGINCWPTLTCMPEQVQQLTSLKLLDLINCGDELKERCRKDVGEDWRIISHIATIRINGEELVINFEDVSGRYL